MTTALTELHAGSAVTQARRWWALAVLASVQFMIVANLTTVNVALPSIQTDLHLSGAGLAWAVNAYLLAAGGVLLLGGRLADLLGRRRMLALGTALFAAASLAAGAAQDTAMLVASRFAQGLGVALAAPAALSLVAVLFPGGRDRARALGVWGGLGALGGVAGLLLSGLLTELVGWRWVFLVNLPVAVAALALLPRLVDESHAPGGRLDLAGAVLATGGLVAVVAGLLAASSRSWGAPGVLGPQLGGVAALTALVLVERRAPDPLLPPRFFASPVRSLAALAMTLMTGAMAAMFLLLSLYLSTVLGYSPLSVGIAYLPFCAVLVVALAASAPLVTRHGHRPTACLAFALAAAGLLLLSRVPAHHASALDLVPAMLLVALGLGLGLPALQGAALDGSAAADAGLAAGVIACVQQLGAAAGLAVLTTLAFRRAASAISGGIPDQAAAVAGYQFAFQVAGLALAAGAVLVLLMTDHPQRRPAAPR
jgi:EmrB/QacA subfamily drug resistance transporter